MPAPPRTMISTAPAWSKAFCRGDASAGRRDIGHRHQAGGQRNGFTGQAVRVTAAVPAFVVAAGDLAGEAEHRVVAPISCSERSSMLSPLTLCVCMMANSSGVWRPA